MLLLGASLGLLHLSAGGSGGSVGRAEGEALRSLAGTAGSILILAAVFLGGPGSAYGAMLGAVIIGLATEISAAYINPSYKDVVAFLALLITMAVRPGGVLGATA